MLKKKRNLAVLLGFLFLFFLGPPGAQAAAENYRQCPNNQSCEIGEYLFDDSYVPITTATCALTVKNPDNTTYLNNQAMTGQSDGWYSYGVSTTGKPDGLYRSTVCCTYGTEYLCIDKSFTIGSPGSTLTSTQVENAVWDADRSDHDTTGTFGENLQNPSSISAADIWSYPNRSLSSFGTLVADIWSYSTRSLNSVAAIVSGVWGNSSRTITSADLGDGSSLAKKSEVESVGAAVEDLEETVEETNTTVTEQILETTTQTNLMIDKIVNKPITETFIDEFEPSVQDLSTKIRNSRQSSKQLQSNVLELQQQVAELEKNWTTLNYVDAANTLDIIIQKLSGSDVAHIADGLKQNWNDPILNNLRQQIDAAALNLTSAKSELRTYGKSFSSKQYLGLVTENLKKIDRLVGTETDSEKAETLYAFLTGVEKSGQKLERQSAEIAVLFDVWQEFRPPEIQSEINRIRSEVVAINRIPRGENFVLAKAGDKRNLENQALALQGLVDSNILLLSQNANQLVAHTWLELGSIVFRMLIQNPSSLQSQDAPVHYYLPEEIREENIISLPEGMSVQFDSNSNRLYVSGTVTLAPNEARTLSIEVEDVWILSDEEIASKRKEAELLFEPLKGTSYFAQGSTLMADIGASLDKIALLQEDAVTPTSKIRAHREASVEMTAVEAKMEDLKTLVGQAGSVGTVFGFVGGVQTLAVWGMIIVLIAGFVFLALYIRLLMPAAAIARRNREEPHRQENHPTGTTKKKSPDDMSTWEMVKDIAHLSISGRRGKRLTAFVFFLLGAGILASLVIIIMQNNSKLASPLPDSPVGLVGYQ